MEQPPDAGDSGAASPDEWAQSSSSTALTDALDASSMGWIPVKGGKRALKIPTQNRGEQLLTAQEFAGDCLRLSMPLPAVRWKKKRAYLNLAWASGAVNYIKACQTEAGDLLFAIDLPLETLIPVALPLYCQHLATWCDITTKEITAEDGLVEARPIPLRRISTGFRLQPETARKQVQELFQQLDLPWREYREDVYVTALEMPFFGTPVPTDFTVRIHSDCVSFCLPFGTGSYFDKDAGADKDVFANILRFNHKQAIGKLAIDDEGLLVLWLDLARPYLGVIDDLSRLSEKVFASGALVVEGGPLTVRMRYE